MANDNDKAVLNAIFNPNTPFETNEDEDNEPNKMKSSYVITDEIQKAKDLEIEDDKTSDSNNEIKSLDDLNKLHRDERKQLQAKIQALKKTVTKGDKKKKKDVDTQIAILEREFDDKCALEIKNFSEKTSSNEVQSTTTGAAASTATVGGDIQDDENLEQQPSKQNKISKAKKRKDKKEEESKVRNERIAQSEIENENAPAKLEFKNIKAKLKSKGLKVKDVQSDGNCMYYAIGDQLSKCRNEIKSIDELRKSTCDYMLKHVDEFQPYLCTDEGEPYDNDKYQEYCENIKNTIAWGSQLELRALSDILKVKIEIVQANGANIIIGENFDDTLIITYHRLMFNSGEHYNSTEVIDPNNDEDNTA